MPTKKTTKRAATKKNEVLLLTCAAVIDRTRMQGLADDFLGYIFVDSGGQYFRVVKVKISERKIIGVFEPAQESFGMFY